MATAVQTVRNQSVRRYKKSAAQEAASRSRSLLLSVASVALILLMVVFMAAYSAKIQKENNDLKAENAYLQAEIDSLNIKISDATSIDHIEEVATKELGMVLPDDSNYIMMEDEDAGTIDLAAMIIEEAYN
ncbi:MAG: cell division protein FtsL [Mogibacterium sp.]|nr:cell division protein FtsL [Mogibacterium sp.]